MTPTLRKHGLRAVLVSIAINALIGIVAIVSGDFSELDAKILVTSLSVTGGAVLALANLATRTERFFTYIPEVGAVFALVGFGLLAYVAWDEFDGENVARVSGTSILFASATAHAGLMSLSRLLPKYLVVLRASWLLVAVLVVMITVLIWASDATDNDAYPRVMGVVIVLFAAATLAIPVLHRASRDELAAAESSSGLLKPAIRHCPSCGSGRLDLEEGEPGSCLQCGARFVVNFQPVEDEKA